jgi:hypothetical protein
MNVKDAPTDRELMELHAKVLLSFEPRRDFGTITVGINGSCCECPLSCLPGDHGPISSFADPRGLVSAYALEFDSYGFWTGKFKDPPISTVGT